MDIPILKRITFNDGERSVLLVDRSGIPLYYPNLYISTQIRSASLALGTIKVSLVALQVLERWQLEFNIDLVQRFRCYKYLDDRELDSLRDYCGLRKDRGNQKNNVVQLKSKKIDVSRNTQYQRMSVIANLLISSIICNLSSEWINQYYQKTISWTFESSTEASRFSKSP